MAVFRIPLNGVNESFPIALAGKDYFMRVYWNGQNSTWNLDLSDAEETIIARGLVIVAGVDIIGQISSHQEIGGKLIVSSDTGENASPTLNNLGSNAILRFITD